MAEKGVCDLSHLARILLRRNILQFGVNVCYQHSTGGVEGTDFAIDLQFHEIYSCGSTIGRTPRKTDVTMLLV